MSRCPRARRHASERRNTSAFPRIASPNTDSISDNLESETGGEITESRWTITAYDNENVPRPRDDRGGANAGSRSPDQSGAGAADGRLESRRHGRVSARL